MGATKFQATLASYGIEASMEFADSIVQAYRAKNKRIKNYWYKLEEAAVKAVQTGKAQKAGPYVFHTSKDFLHIHMPCVEISRTTSPSYALSLWATGSLPRCGSDHG